MNRRPRRNHTSTFKAKVALAALKGDRTLAQLRESTTQKFSHKGVNGANSHDGFCLPKSPNLRKTTLARAACDVAVLPPGSDRLRSRSKIRVRAVPRRRQIARCRPVAARLRSYGGPERVERCVPFESSLVLPERRWFKRNVFGKVLLDEFHHASLLPWGKPAAVGRPG
jgi:hypothetical protein